ncbi:MAG: hypothetical protein COR54_05295 [Elusimicrobia bacterium CG22_combo_CG10-13_8_21_14_all_63_91]|nr:MAG: hypothetical protein COR54_05295 [Elusimicrobia bacterium CG22_combo_CG10-13_8_21_14_all_63_91]
MIRLGIFALLCACSAGAQETLGLSADPALIGINKSGADRQAVTELGLAVSLAFDATTWIEVGVSTPPVQAASLLIKKGHYRLELLQLVLIAKDSKGRLLDLTAKRAKGASLRSLAQEAGVDYDGVYVRAGRLAVEVDRRLKENARVRADISRPGEEPPSPPRKRRKR